MALKEGMRVRLEYELSTEDLILETTEARGPVEVTLGQGGLSPVIAKAVLGFNVGERFELVLDPSLAFGDPDPSFRFTISRSKLPAHCAQMQVGAEFEGPGPDRRFRTFRVVGADELRITIDGNHPLAGETLYLKGRVLEVFESSENVGLSPTASAQDANSV